MCTCCEPLQKRSVHQWLAFQTVSKARTYKLYICFTFSYKVRILYTRTSFSKMLSYSISFLAFIIHEIENGRIIVSLFRNLKGTTI